MNRIMQPMRWWDMVSPREEEMPDFLRAYMGKGKQFRTPKRIWQDLWMRKRGEMNHILGMRKFGTIKIFNGPKYQKGIICATAFGVATAGGTSPALSTFSHTHTELAASASRIQLAWDSDGTLEHYFGTTVGLVVWTQLTTQSDDGNNHTNEWWPDNPETNEGLNWDIRRTNPTNDAFSFHLQTSVPADRAVDDWFLLDDVSNDHADAAKEGCLSTRIGTKGSGTTNSTTDIEIRIKDTGNAVASHNVDFTVISTGT